MSIWSIERKSAACWIRNTLGDFRFRAYELADSTGQIRSVVALSRGALQDGLLVRINSGCMTSELFGDGSCDCGWQLSRSLEMIVQEGSGVLIHAAWEEGRGSGIVNKVNSLSLMQTSGYLSSQAFSKLDLPLDARDYGYAGAVLREMGVRSVRCITNNPQKVATLEQFGIAVASTVEIVARERSDLYDFYVDKVAAQGHRINLLGEPVQPVVRSTVVHE